MMKPFFSVVIPLYNKEHSVCRSIRSVLGQSFTDFELIVVDDGSSDTSAALVLSIDDPLIQLVKQKNSGPSVARNYGIKLSKADFVCFLDADDEWDSGFLENIFSLIKSAPKASLYSARYCVMSEAGKLFHHISQLPKDFMGYIDDFYSAYSARGLVNSSCACVRKTSLLQIGGFPEGARTGEDIYTWLRLIDLRPMAHVNKELVIIHKDAENRVAGKLFSDLPYHIKTILESGAQEFCLENRLQVVEFIVANAHFQIVGAVLKGDRRQAYQMVGMLFQYSWIKAIQGLIIAGLPIVILNFIKQLRNS